MAERSLLRTLEGGCQVPIGAYALASPTGLYLDALVGSKILRGSKKDPEILGKTLAKDLLKAGAKTILQEIYNTSRNL